MRFSCQKCFSLISQLLPFAHTHTQLLLIGDSGVGKSCLLLRFAVSFAAKRAGGSQMLYGGKLLRAAL
jgi:predicted ATPase